MKPNNNNSIKIVIGSWGSYNECNERALGSKWLDLTEYSDWEEIIEELKEEGFELNGLDEELFIQDIENFPTEEKNGDYVNPKKFFETLKQSGVLDDNEKYQTMIAYIEIQGYNYWEKLVERNDENWDQDVYLYKGYDWYDLGYELLHEGNEIPKYLDDYIDYEKYGKELEFDGYHEYSGGIVEIRR